MRHLTEDEQTLAAEILAHAAKILAHNTNLKTLDGVPSFDIAEQIVKWVTENPHFAIRIATLAHACKWFGCDCVAHQNAISTLTGERKVWRKA